MRLFFDPDFGCGFWPGPQQERKASAGEAWVGPASLLGVLETALGLTGPPVTASARAAKLITPLQKTQGFWSGSAEVDPFGSARRLLLWRDTLVMCGWRGGGKSPRFTQLSSLMSDALPGLPDRIAAVNAVLPMRDPSVESITLFTPLTDLEPLWRATLGLLEAHGARIKITTTPPASASGDLGAARGSDFVPKGDGTLRMLRPRGNLTAAEDVAGWLASLDHLRDTVIVGNDTVLDAALRRHGLPTTGAEPTYHDSALLQVLPLTLELAWSPQDPQRALELLSLPVNPLSRGLRYGLINALNKWPAVDSDSWRAAIAEGLEKLDEDRRSSVGSRLDVLWSAVVPHGRPCPADEVARRAHMVRDWLYGHWAQGNTAAEDWRAATRQCDALLGLLDRSGQSAIPAAQLRRLVVEATRDSSMGPVWPAEAGLRVVGAPGGIVGPVARVVWWSFDEASVPVISRLPLSAAERADLESLGCELPDPGQQAAALARRWHRPLDQAMGSLLLVCPERDSKGGESFPHPLWDDLLARIPSSADRRRSENMLVVTSLAKMVPAARRVTHSLQPLPAPRHSWKVPPGSLVRRQRESPSSAEAFLGCSFHWVLRYAGKLGGVDSLALPGPEDPRLLGSLFHHLLERLLEQPGLTPDQALSEAMVLFDREGPRLAAPLFMPGAEASRAVVRGAAAKAARALFVLMKSAGVRVIASEKEYVAKAMGTEFAGRPDIVLGDPARIVDMKWSGASWRLRQLANGTATQLASYSFLLRGTGRGAFPPVAYFILKDQRLLSASPGDFPSAEAVVGPDPAATWALFEATHAELWKEAKQGVLHARGVPDEQGNEPPDETKVVDGQMVFEPPCRFCDFGALCGRDLAEGS